MKKSFILYNDLQEVVKDLNDEQAGKLFKMILSYTDGNEVQADDLILKIAFTPIKLQLDRDSDKYEKYINKQRENGAKGGRPKTQKTQRLKNKPKKADTVNDTVTDSDNDNETVNVSDINTRTPPESEFLDYCFGLCLETNKDFEKMRYTFQAKYLAWKEDGWRDGNGKEIKNWKTKIRNTLPYLKPIDNGQKITDGFRETHEALGGSKLS